MKGIVKYKQKFYKKDKNTTNLKKGDLIKLECERGSDYFKYNGIYTIISDSREIHIPNYDGKGMTLCLKLGYNVCNTFFKQHYWKLVENQKKKSLPYPAKEEKLRGYTI